MLLMLLLVGIVVVWLLRSRPIAPAEAEVREMQQFERMVDSIQQHVDSVKLIKEKKKSQGRRPKRTRSRQASGQRTNPHEISPVPQF